MITGPDPHLPEVLLAAAAKLSFNVTWRDSAGRELGVLSDTAGHRGLVIGAGSAPGTAVWTLVEGPLPRMAYLLTHHAFDALQGGRLEANGTLLYQGTQYRLRACFDGVAELIKEHTAA